MITAMIGTVWGWDITMSQFIIKAIVWAFVAFVVLWKIVDEFDTLQTTRRSQRHQKKTIDDREEKRHRRKFPRLETIFVVQQDIGSRAGFGEVDPLSVINEVYLVKGKDEDGYLLCDKWDEVDQKWVASDPKYKSVPTYGTVPDKHAWIPKEYPQPTTTKLFQKILAGEITISGDVARLLLEDDPVLKKEFARACDKYVQETRVPLIHHGMTQEQAQDIYALLGVAYS